MKIICYRRSLLSACELAIGAVAPRDVKPCLKNFKLSAVAEKLVLMATDLEIGIRVNVVPGLKIKEAGEALVSAKLLEILQKSGGAGEEVEIVANREKIVVIIGADKYEMNAADPAAFPDVPMFKARNFHTLTVEAMRRAITQTVYASAKEGQVRFGATTGVLWKLNGSKATLVATDGKRLARAEVAAMPHGNATKNSAGVENSVISKKTMRVLGQGIAGIVNQASPVKIEFRSHEAMIEASGFTIYSRLVEGRFPSCEEVVPKKTKRNAVFFPRPVAAAFERAAIMTDEDAEGVVCTFSGGNMVLGGEVKEGKSYVHTPVEYAGEPFEIKLNPMLVAECLRAADSSEKISLGMNSANDIVVFRQSNFLYLVVPMVTEARAT